MGSRYIRVSCNYLNIYYYYLHSGVLSPIQSIQKIRHDQTSDYEWIAPFSLNLTGIDPDIVYCVSVYDVTCQNHRVSVDKDCSVISPMYTTTWGNLNSVRRFEIVVLPKLNSINALNGTTSTTYRGKSVSSESTVI